MLIFSCNDFKEDMIIDFASIHENKIPHFKNGEGYIKNKTYEDEYGNKVMINILDPNCSIGYHVHKDNCEMVYVIKGTLTCLFDNAQTLTLKEGEIHYCPKGHGHCLKNDTYSEVKIYCVVPTQK